MCCYQKATLTHLIRTIGEKITAPYLPCQWRRVGPVSIQCTSQQLYPLIPVAVHTLYLLQIPLARQTRLEYYASVTKEEDSNHLN